MITTEMVTSVVTSALFFDRLTVKRLGKDVFSIISYSYGEEEVRHKGGTAEEIAKFMNGYFFNKTVTSEDIKYAYSLKDLANKHDISIDILEEYQGKFVAPVESFVVADYSDLEVRMSSLYREQFIEEMEKAEQGSIVSMGCKNCEGYEKHKKVADGWVCQCCGHKE